MDHYVKTHLGVQALKQRSFQLNARQRQLLLLIGTDDFRILNSAMKQRLATPEIIQQLEQLGLIFSGQQSSNHSVEYITEKTNHVEPNQPVKNVQHESLNTKNLHTTDIADEKATQSNIDHESIENLMIQHQKINESPLQQQKQDTNFIQKNDVYLDMLNFDEVKQTMMGLLKLHCGLMAKQLVLKIQQAQSVREIKLCQMQWITALQETRIPRDELNFNMQQINRSLQHLYRS